MFTEQLAEPGNDQNLGLLISKQICRKLRGDLRFEKSNTGQQIFIFFVQCIDKLKKK